MTYWSNKQILDTLKVERLSNSVLVFQAPLERAEVHLSLDGGDIEEIIFSAEGGTQIDEHHRFSGVNESTIKKDAAHCVVVGEGQNETRDVVHFLKPGGPAPTMRLGITHHRGEGTWSSLPHDFELNTEPGFEEVFFYVLKGGTQKAIQVGRGMWHDGEDVDGVWPVRNETFGTVPMGYHPVVGEPGVRVSYVWAYLAKHKHWEKI
ncbi:hypothetical protein CL630_02650 [bacterium]|nr:hypothetical protein [bacterium]|tara:strand:- start:4907 stop:5524 length:618 start_codon:yes stop_codon:yes gene_type:complete